MKKKLVVYLKWIHLKKKLQKKNNDAYEIVKFVLYNLHSTKHSFNL